MEEPAHLSARELPEVERDVSVLRAQEVLALLEAALLVHRAHQPRRGGARHEPRAREARRVDSKVFLPRDTQFLGSPTAPQVRTLRRVSSWISLRRENDALRFAFWPLGPALRRCLGRSNGNGNSPQARFDLGLRLPDEKAFLARASPKF